MRYNGQFRLVFRRLDDVKTTSKSGPLGSRNNGRVGLEFRSDYRRLRQKSPPPVLVTGSLCGRDVRRSDVNVVPELAELFGQGLSAIDKEPWFGFGTLLDVAYSLMKNLPDQTA